VGNDFSHLSRPEGEEVLAVVFCFVCGRVFFRLIFFAAQKSVMLTLVGAAGSKSMIRRRNAGESDRAMTVVKTTTDQHQKESFH